MGGLYRCPHFQVSALTVSTVDLHKLTTKLKASSKLKSPNLKFENCICNLLTSKFINIPLPEAIHFHVNPYPTYYTIIILLRHNIIFVVTGFEKPAALYVHILLQDIEHIVICHWPYHINV